MQCNRPLTNSIEFYITSQCLTTLIVLISGHRPGIDLEVHWLNIILLNTSVFGLRSCNALSILASGQTPVGAVE